MCHPSVLTFVEETVGASHVENKDVIEVGSYDVNGSVRPYLTSLNPKSYVGVDIMEGPGVDIVCNAEDLVEKFGESSFDLVVSTEMLEHVRDWQKVIENLKLVTRPGGTIIITTRSRTFPIHGYPHDHWRYQTEDMRTIFADFDELEISEDVPTDPGVLVSAVRPDVKGWKPLNLSGYALWSVHTDVRVLEAEDDVPEMTFDEAVELLAQTRIELENVNQRYRQLESCKSVRYPRAVRHRLGRAVAKILG